MRLKNLMTCVAAATCVLGQIGTAGLAEARDKIMADNQLLRLQVYPGAILNLPIWVAIDRGFCAQHDLRCETSTIPSGPLALQALFAGSVDVILTANDVGMVAAARGVDVQAITGVITNNIYTLSVRADVPLPNKTAGYPAIMKDIQGLKVGVTARGASTEIQARALLSGAGISPDAVTYVAVGAPASAYPSIAAKQIDAALMFEPLRTLCDALKTCINAVTLATGEGPPELRSLNGGFVAYDSSRTFITKHPQAIDAFIQAMTEAIAWMQQADNFDEVVRLTRKRLTLGDIPNGDAILVDLVRAAVPTFGVKIDRASIKAFSDFLLHYKQIEAPVDPASFVYAKSP